MVQFNLLPDIKLEYIKTRRLKKLVMTFSILLAIASLVIAILLFIAVNIVQKKYMSDLNVDIVSTTKKLQDTPNLDRILTVQNQLTQLPALHAKKPAASRIFNYLSQVTPTGLSITNANVDFVLNTMTIDGEGTDLLSVNKYVDTLKFTDYVVKVDGASTDVKTKAFSQVVLAGFTAAEKNATYQISLSFDPSIFDNQKEVTLVVPKTITTRSTVNRPTDDLFKKKTDEGIN